VWDAEYGALMHSQPLRSSIVDLIQVVAVHSQRWLVVVFSDGICVCLLNTAGVGTLAAVVGKGAATLRFLSDNSTAVVNLPPNLSLSDLVSKALKTEGGKEVVQVQPSLWLSFTSDRHAAEEQRALRQLAAGDNATQLLSQLCSTSSGDEDLRARKTITKATKKQKSSKIVATNEPAYTPSAEFLSQAVRICIERQTWEAVSAFLLTNKVSAVRVERLIPALISADQSALLIECLRHVCDISEAHLVSALCYFLSKPPSDLSSPV
jgi:hypothetical protein